ncbi:hypothetical protein PAPYR_10132 [Paratrimastix pyriformis]|uniref:Uncharacterized protein n=1 Tax=Paratrimastix pyriformis TaxID=342808 RepID=A0ABQ8U6N8_9EUKA|nr:hypothetical protein PAPYR_10132 [Paratrimastix pyriformis]
MMRPLLLISLICGAFALSTCEAECRNTLERCLTATLDAKDIQQGLQDFNHCLQTNGACFSQCHGEKPPRGNDQCVENCASAMRSCIQSGAQSCMTKCNDDVRSPCMFTCALDLFTTCVDANQYCNRGCRLGTSMEPLLEQCSGQCRPNLKSCLRGVAKDCLRPNFSPDQTKNCALHLLSSCLSDNEACYSQCLDNAPSQTGSQVDKADASLTGTLRYLKCIDQLVRGIVKNYAACQLTCPDSGGICMQTCMVSKAYAQVSQFQQCLNPQAEDETPAQEEGDAEEPVGDEAGALLDEGLMDALSVNSFFMPYTKAPIVSPFVRIAHSPPHRPPPPVPTLNPIFLALMSHYTRPPSFSFPANFRSIAGANVKYTYNQPPIYTAPVYPKRNAQLRPYIRKRPNPLFSFVPVPAMTFDDDNVLAREIGTTIANNRGSHKCALVLSMLRNKEPDHDLAECSEGATPILTADALAAIVGPCKGLIKLTLPTRNVVPPLVGCGLDDAACLPWVREAFAGHSRLAVLHVPWAEPLCWAIRHILPLLPGLEELYFLKALNDSSFLETLNDLDVQIPGVQALESLVSCFPDLKHLTVCHDLYSAPAAPHPLHVAAGFSGLQSLSLTSFSSAVVAQLLAASQATLQSIKLNIFEDEISPTLLAALGRLSHLTGFTLCPRLRCQTKSVLEAFWPFIDRLECLALKIWWCSIPTSISSSNLRKLTISMRGAPLTPALEELTLPYSDFGGHPLVLACPRLRSLELGASTVDFSAALPALPDLVHICGPEMLNFDPSLAPCFSS